MENNTENNATNTIENNTISISNNNSEEKNEICKNKTNKKLLITIIICLTILLLIITYILFVKEQNNSKKSKTPEVIPTESVTPKDDTNGSTNLEDNENKQDTFGEKEGIEELTSEQVLNYLNTKFTFADEMNDQWEKESSPIIGLLSFNFTRIDSEIMRLKVLDYSEMIRYSRTKSDKINEICKDKTGYTTEEYKKKYNKEYLSGLDYSVIFADLDILKETFKNITGSELVLSKEIKNNKYYKYNAISSIRSDELHIINSIKSVEITSHVSDIYSVNYVANYSYYDEEIEEEGTTTGKLQLRQDGELLYIISNDLKGGSKPTDIAG